MEGEGKTSVVQGLILAFHSEITPSRLEETIWNVRDQIWVVHTQGTHPSYWWFFVFLIIGPNSLPELKNLELLLSFSFPTIGSSSDLFLLDALRSFIRQTFSRKRWAECTHSFPTSS